MTTLSLRARGGRRAHVWRELGLTALACPVLAYRAIPPGVRRWWSFGCSTSHLALAMLADPRATFWRAAGKLALYAVPRLKEGWSPFWPNDPRAAEWGIPDDKFRRGGLNDGPWRSGKGWGD